jgi:hypothetical protein
MAWAILAFTVEIQITAAICYGGIEGLKAAAAAT